MSEREGTLTVTTWTLEMRAVPSRALRRPPGGARIERVARPEVHLYRYLYETVGREWLWVDRRRMGDAELGEIIRHPAVELWVLYDGGAPSGYYELDGRVPDAVELAYFGLFPHAIGRGLGSALLDHSIGRAFELLPPGPAARFWVHTCSLDHPRALGTYQRAGFVVIDELTHPSPDPRPLPITPR